MLFSHFSDSRHCAFTIFHFPSLPLSLPLSFPCLLDNDKNISYSLMVYRDLTQRFLCRGFLRCQSRQDWWNGVLSVRENRFARRTSSRLRNLLVALSLLFLPLSLHPFLQLRFPASLHLCAFPRRAMWKQLIHHHSRTSFTFAQSNEEFWVCDRFQKLQLTKKENFWENLWGSDFSLD